MANLILLPLFFAVFYFLLIRPQQKRAKEHTDLISSLEAGDDVLTTAGIYGTIVSIDGQIAELEIADGVIVRIQRSTRRPNSRMGHRQRLLRRGPVTLRAPQGGPAPRLLRRLHAGHAGLDVLRRELAGARPRSPGWCLRRTPARRPRRERGHPEPGRGHHPEPDRRPGRRRARHHPPGRDRAGAAPRCREPRPGPGGDRPDRRPELPTGAADVAARRPGGPIHDRGADHHGGRRGDDDHGTGRGHVHDGALDVHHRGARSRRARRPDTGGERRRSPSHDHHGRPHDNRRSGNDGPGLDGHDRARRRGGRGCSAPASRTRPASVRTACPGG